MFGLLYMYYVHMESVPKLHVVLDGSSVCRQLLDQLRTLCVEGTLRPDQKLPSVRQMAGDLGVHHNTVAEAYRLLADKGWLAIEHGRGARVLNRQAPRTPGQRTVASHVARLRNLIAELRALGLDPEWIRDTVNATLNGSEGTQ